MKVERLGSDLPWPYGHPGQLQVPSPDQSFDEYIGRLAMFTRDSILDTGSRVLWYPWQKNVPFTETPGSVVTETSGPDVIGYAMMFCPRVGRVDATELDFRHLAWELFQLRSGATFGSAAADEEKARLATRWTELLGKTPFGRLDASQEAEYLRALWMCGRIVAAQLLSLPFIDEESARILLLHEALEAAASDRAHAYRKFVRVYFEDDVRHLLRHAVVLAGRVMRDTGSVACPGRFDVFPANESANDVVDFAQLARLACRPASSFPAMGKLLLQLPEHQRKLSLDARPLTLRPGIVLDDWKDRLAFAYPAPRRLLRSLHRLFVDDFIDFCASDEHFVERVGLPAPSLLGRATHRYLSDAVGPHVLVVDDSECPVRGKKPDAVWCGEHFGVIFEAKARVTPRVDPECSTPDALLEAWRRCWEAVAQASEFILDGSAKQWVKMKTGRDPDRWVLAIIVDEDLVAERTSFRHATSHWGLLADTGLAGVAIVTVGCLERVVGQLTADAFGQSVERAWLDAGGNVLEQPDEEPALPSIDRPAYLEQALRRLLADD